MKKKNLLKDILKDSIDNLPVYYKTAEKTPVSGFVYSEYNATIDGDITISDNYYKPVSKITIVKFLNKKSILLRYRFNSMLLFKEYALLSFGLLITINVLGQKLSAFEKDSIKIVMNKIKENDQKFRGQLTYGELDLVKIDSIERLPDTVRWMIIENANYRNGGFSKTIRDSLWYLQTKLDSLNMLTFLYIIKNYGYPSYDRVGSLGAHYLTFHLVRPQQFEILLPVLKNELKRRNLSPREYASWYDNCQLSFGKKQLYGAHNTKFPCVEDLKETNKARRKIGLYKLKENKCQ